MKKIALIFGLIPFAAMAETDAEIALNGVIDNVRNQCGGISANLESLKKMAGIGTAVNAVGTVAGAGGVVSGIVKYNKDSNIGFNMGQKYSIELIKEKLKEKTNSPENQRALSNFQQAAPDFNWDEIDAGLDKLSKDYEKMSSDEQAKYMAQLDAKAAAAQKAIDDNQKASDTFGNIRTGLFATNTATSVAGAVISSKTNVDEDLAARIKACSDSMVALQDASARVRFEDGANANTALLEKSQNILDKCSQYKDVDTDSLNKLAHGATISGAVGGATGLAATITSIMGTNNKVSDVDLKSENAVDELNKHSNINVASNILGGVTAATSLTGTVLNATQIKKIKNVVTISENCEEALQ